MKQILTERPSALLCTVSPSADSYGPRESDASYCRTSFNGKSLVNRRWLPDQVDEHELGKTEELVSTVNDIRHRNSDSFLTFGNARHCMTLRKMGKFKFTMRAAEQSQMLSPA
jgi:hypothetical protein